MTARRVYRCELCSLPIVVGVRHTAVSSLYEGRWTRTRVHDDCYALTSYIQIEICDQDDVVIMSGDLREEVREHRAHREVISRYRQVLRARIREGVWPVRRAA